MKKILNFFKRHYIKFIILAIVVVVAIIFVNKNNNSRDKNIIVNDITVERGDVINSLDGKSTIEPKNSYVVTSSVTGDVIECTFEEGDYVNKDDKMYQIDTEDMDKSLKSAKLNVEKAEMNIKTIKDNINDLTVTSRYSGIVKKLNVEQGDTISNNTVIAEVYDPNNLKISIPFNENDVKYLWVGEKVNVTLISANETIDGVISSIDSDSNVLNGYMRVKNVKINVVNNGGISVGDKAIASVGDISCNDYGVFEYITNDSILSTGSGEIISLNIEEGQAVYKDQVVLQLKNDDLSTSLRNAEISLEEANLNLEQVKDKIDKYTIKAPISGTVITKNTKLGDKIDTSSGLLSMATIFDLSSVKFDISIDEVEIAQLSVGQQVTIYADAVSDKSYNGVIENINIDGKSSNGVTTYPVTVRIDEYDGLLPGMNIDADIVVEEAKDVLKIPTSSVNRGNIVYVKGEKKDDKDNAPEGYYSVEVETGITDGTYIEIKKGLKEGDVIRGKELVAEGLNIEKMMEMHGSPNSGMPGGGMPSGGMPGGR